MEEGARESSTDSETKEDTSYHLTAIVSNIAITDLAFLLFKLFSPRHYSLDLKKATENYYINTDGLCSQCSVSSGRFGHHIQR